MNYQTRLNQFLQRNSRQSIAFRYRRISPHTGAADTFRMQLNLGMARFYGEECATKNAARESAAERPLAELWSLDENEAGIRLALGLMERYRLRQIDAIRNSLRVLKQRARQLYGPRNEMIRREILNIYQSGDRIEALFVDAGIIDPL